jgi:hypothetical protein
MPTKTAALRTLIPRGSQTAFSTALDRPPERRGTFEVSDAKGVPLAYVSCRDDLESVRFAHHRLKSDFKARRIANGIAARSPS